MRIYIGNKMRGVPESNYPWFKRASEYVKELGHVPVTPADIDEVHGTQQGDAGLSDAQLGNLLKLDFQEILDSDAVALGPQWRDSFGAKAERQVAEWIGLPIYYVDPDARTFEEAHDSAGV